MKFLLQRVNSASVYIQDTNTTNTIGQGFLVYVGISTQDLEENRKEKINRFIRRVGKYPLFSNESITKSVSLTDIQGELLIISNFTLYARNKKSKDIDFGHASPYDAAEEVYNYLTEQLSKTNIPFQAGKFGALMKVKSTNV